MRGRDPLLVRKRSLLPDRRAALLLGRDLFEHSRPVLRLAAEPVPAVAPDLSYDALDGVQDGGMAMDAFREAISPRTSKAEKAQIEQQFLDYCRLDTYAMVRLWQFFAARNDLKFDNP